MRIFTTYLLKAAIALPVLFTLNSCTRTTGPNPTTSSTVYYQHYTVTYDKDSSTTRATAQFRTDTATGYIHTLTQNESLNINKQLAGYNASTREYTYNYNKLVNVEYVFTKNAGRQFLNMVRTTDTNSLSFPSIFPASINQNSGMTITWDGRALFSDERLFLVVNDMVHAPVYKELTNGLWMYGSGDLNNLTPGDVKVSLELLKTLPLHQADTNSSGKMEVILRTSRWITLL